MNDCCRPLYNDQNLPPLIPLERDPRSAVQPFPILDNTSLKAQLNALSGNTVDPPLNEAYRVINQQNLQIEILDELVRQLQEEKAVLESQLEQFLSLDTPCRNPPSNSITASPTHRVHPSSSGTTHPSSDLPSRSHCTGPSFVASSASRPPASLHMSSVGQVPPSQHSRPPIQRSHFRDTPQPSHQRVFPLRVLGPATIDIFEHLWIADHHHNTVCDIVESALPAK